MTYKVFYTDRHVSEVQYRASKPSLICYAFDDLDDALGKSRQIKEYGGIAWEIECPDGTLICRSEIAEILHKRKAELASRPKVY